MDPELARTTKQTKSKLFPSTAKWPDTPKKQRPQSAQVVGVKVQEPEVVSKDDQTASIKQTPVETAAEATNTVVIENHPTEPPIPAAIETVKVEPVIEESKVKTPEKLAAKSILDTIGEREDSR